MKPALDYKQSMFSAGLAVMRVESPDTSSLLDMARKGDPEAFGELCREHEARLFRQAMTWCGNAALAEDLTQDTLIAAWKSLRRYNGRCQFFTWLCAILLNQHRNSLREKQPLPLDDEAGESADGHDAPDQAALAGEKAAAVRRCIAALPPKQRQAIFLRFYVEDSLAEIAAALGCSVGTVKSRLFYAMENLRRMNLNL
jgi:RNA polymerase sigma-70 factor (ECF subfamily)